MKGQFKNTFFVPNVSFSCLCITKVTIGRTDMAISTLPPRTFGGGFQQNIDNKLIVLETSIGLRPSLFGN